MSKEQIEEMAIIACNSTHPEFESVCAECPFDKMCSIQNACEALYDADYRKQSEGKWIEVAAYNDGVLNTAKCSVCGTYQRVGLWDYHPYCPHCGAKMKGGE